MPGTVPGIEATEAKARLDAEAADGAPRPLIVDVRNPDEFVQVRIEGSVLIPMPELSARVSELPRDRPLFVLCHSGSRSAMAAGHLRALGFPDVANLDGGIVAWYRAGLPVKSGAIEPGEGTLPD